MPKYLDHHGPVSLPPSMAQQMVTEMKAGKVSPLGVKGINAFFGKNDAWCLTEAPNADVICKYHEAMGIKLPKGDVVEVSTLL